MPRYAELIYNGFWFSPEREMLQALIDQQPGERHRPVRLKLYKGNVQVVGRTLAAQPLRRCARDLRGRHGLRPARRRRLHQAERAPPPGPRPRAPAVTSGALEVDFYYGLGSRYSYLASTQIERLEVRHRLPGELAAALQRRSVQGARRRSVPGPTTVRTVRVGVSAARCRMLGRLLRRVLSRARGCPLRAEAPCAGSHRRRPPRCGRTFQPPAAPGALRRWYVAPR